ncbi:uncharacterized protein [Panulirus ornatus]|uniref:uncharacterized protein isoform X1 n=1 Tax=Panulirus ornatus TaxID=150431 RepID=UPI003A891789
MDEFEEFVDLIRTLNSTKVSMSHCPLGKHIDDKQQAVKEAPINTCDGLTYLVTTPRNRSFLGMTANWIDPVTRANKHAVLTCTLLTGHHTYGVLMGAMVQVHKCFNIQDNTNNGSNFMKAFSPSMVARCTCCLTSVMLADCLRLTQTTKTTRLMVTIPSTM